MHGFDEKADTLDINTLKGHVMRKANVVRINDRQVASESWSGWFKRMIEGDTANQRYRRAAHESSQRVSAARIAQARRAEIEGRQIDLHDDPLVKQRFYSQDNLRTNSHYSRVEYGQSLRNRVALGFSRMANIANGGAEIGAAPTGALVRGLRIFTHQKVNEARAKSQLRLLVNLPFVGAAVTGLSLGMTMIRKGPFLAATSAAHAEFLRNSKAMAALTYNSLALNWNALCAAASAVSLVSSLASKLTIKHERLSPALQKITEVNQDKQIHRLHILIREASKSDSGRAIVARAMGKKVNSGMKEFNPDLGIQEPKLLKDLIQSCKGVIHKDKACAQIKRVLGDYMCKADPRDENSPLIDPVKHKRFYLRRERHVLGLLNLVEHARLDTHPSHPNFKDLRLHFDAGVEGGRKLVGKTLGKATGKKGPERWGSGELSERSEAVGKKPADRARVVGTLPHILKNHHQYSRATVYTARLAEGGRVLTTGILMSLNYLGARPVAFGFSKLTEAVTASPRSRMASFSVGRVVSSAAWAVIDNFFLVPLIQGVGLFGKEAVAATGNKFLPWQVPGMTKGMALTATSTALQMFVTTAASLGLNLVAMGLAKNGGWHGDIQRNNLKPNFFTGRTVMDAWK